MEDCSDLTILKEKDDKRRSEFTLTLRSLKENERVQRRVQCLVVEPFFLRIISPGKLSRILETRGYDDV
jgi:hypothetical protein